jgi:hypothetical protein
LKNRNIESYLSTKYKKISEDKIPKLAGVFLKVEKDNSK